MSPKQKSIVAFRESHTVGLNSEGVALDGIIHLFQKKTTPFGVVFCIFSYTPPWEKKPMFKSTLVTIPGTLPLLVYCHISTR